MNKVYVLCQNENIRKYLLKIVNVLVRVLIVSEAYLSGHPVLQFFYIKETKSPIDLKLCMYTRYRDVP